MWLRAPLLLRRHPPLLAAIVLISALAALAAAATPYVRAGVESESLKGELRTMSPLAAGLDLDVRGGGTIAQDVARRAAATRFARRVPYVGKVVVSSRLPVQVGNAAGNGLSLYAVARTGAVAHVRHLASVPGRGVWIADTTAKATRLRPGGTLLLTEGATLGVRPRVVRLRVAGVYLSLAGDAGNPYWVNWLQDVRSLNPLAPDPPAYVLMSEPTLVHVAKTLAPYAQNRFEFAVDPTNITLGRARALKRRLDSLGRQLTRTQSVGCRARGQCVATSSLDAALKIATRDVGAVGPTISLLSSAALLIALGLAVAAGAFLVWRRRDEAHALDARGESPVVFGARTGVESVLPSVLGGVLGVAIALGALHEFAPDGTLDGRTAAGGVLRAAAAVGVAVVAVGAGAAAAFAGRRPELRARVPWELVPLAIASALAALVLLGGGLTATAAGTAHPRLAVFLLPAFAAIGVTGLATRGMRRALRPRGARAWTPLFFAVRRVSAARGVLVVVIVAAATSFAMFAYAATLRSSLARAAEEKAFVSNGSDVQGYIDPSERVTSPFSFPVAIVELDQANVSFASGARVDLIAGDPNALARTLRWGNGWGDDPRPLLKRLDAPTAGRLPALATPDAPDAHAIDDQGVRIPITIVGRAPFPGQSAGRPALVVSRRALRRIGRRVGIVDPAPLASGILWAKGPPRVVERALLASNLAPQYLTTPAHILDDPAVSAADRSFAFVRDIGAAAGALALVALLLYLQARQRAQVIASSFLRRMGMSRRSDLGGVALEAGALAAFATVLGAVVAVATAWPVVGHIDALPQYAPPTHVVVPWAVLAAGVGAAIVAGALLGIAAVAVAARANVGEALRVA